MKLKIYHLTKYVYQEPVINSVNEIRLSPRTDSYQTCEEHNITIEPKTPLYVYEDYFGNSVNHFTVTAPHKELKIESYSIVSTSEERELKQKEKSFEDERNLLSSESFQNRYAEYLMETDYTKVTKDLVEFCRNVIKEDQADCTYGLLNVISNAIHTHFTYDASATNVQTTVENTLALRRGVCQDYAHLMIAICRIFSIPARYVSGYQFIGDVNNDEIEVQHASHAWVEAFVPFVGWREFDPTSNDKINWRYVKIGNGRNYSDIVPVKGIYHGIGQHLLEVLVDIKVIKKV